ncbi:unnamed protein product [Rotaria sp. Silwood2]|nr:unnamed protein product [Rotaria sp. Silwood2]
MAEVAWTSLQPLLTKLIEQQHKIQIYLISDSLVSQYRNKTSAFMIKQYCKRDKIDINWIFYESGHGKGIPDAVGASLKNKFDQIVVYYSDDAFQAASDLVTTVKNDTETKLFLYEKSDIDVLKEQIPKLKAVKGTARMYELIGRKNEQLYMANPGFLGMLDLIYGGWDQDETYGG